MRNYPDWLAQYQEYCKDSEAPDNFHYWTGVSVMAGALRRRVWLDMKYFQWTPNMYIIFVAPPGIVSKSTTASIGMNLLRQVDGVKFGPDAVTWQALIAQLEESTEMFQLHEGEEEYHVMSALTCVCSEFGNFLNPHDREMVDALVSLWDGQVGTWSKVTKTQGNDHIENPWINVLACTTPDWIAGNFPDYMIGGGFTSRCVFVYAETKRKLVAYPDHNGSTEHDEIKLKLIQDLGHIANTIAGPYKLSREARLYGEVWYEEHYKAPPEGLVGERFGGYLARKQTHIHKLAMVIAASQSDSLTLEMDHLHTAALEVDKLEADLPKVFGRIGVDHKQRDVKELIYFVHHKGEIANADLYARVVNRMSVKDYQAATDGAVALGYLKKLDRGGKIFFCKGPLPPP